jgi:hypothetical protein
MKDMNIEEMKAAIKDLDAKKSELAKALKEKEDAEEAARKQKLADEKEARKAHVISLMEEAENALQKYVRDYGPLVRHTDDDDFFPYYLFHNFLF